MATITFEGSPADHQRVEQWVMRAGLVDHCGLMTPLLSSGIDYRRDVRLTRAATKAFRTWVRVLEIADEQDETLFDMTMRATGTLRIISIA